MQSRDRKSRELIAPRFGGIHGDMFTCADKHTHNLSGLGGTCLKAACVTASFAPPSMGTAWNTSVHDMETSPRAGGHEHDTI
eukprot:6198113-Pleurochrysis_carterae.AAC.2